MSINENLVMVIDGDIEKKSLSKAYLQNRLLFQRMPGDKFNPITPEDASYHNIDLEPEVKVRNIIYPPRYPSQRALFADRIGELFGIQHLRRFVRRKLRLALLLDTRGGNVNGANEVIRLMNRVRSSCGDVLVFGGRAVSSAGTDIFMNAEAGSRFLSHETKMMFHSINFNYQSLFEAVDGDAEKIAEIVVNLAFWRLQSWHEIVTFLTQKAPPHKKDLLQRHIEDTTFDGMRYHGEPRVQFSGSQAEEFGFARTTQSLRKEFERICNVSQKSYEKTAIEDFFARVEKL